MAADDDGSEATRTFSVFNTPPETVSTVIVGAGIIGCATAYYLAHAGHTKPDTIHLVESSPELFASASGKSGGFLAADWFGPATTSLGALSFRLHKQLADEHEGAKNWGYIRSTGTSLTEGSNTASSKGYDWIRTGGSRSEAAAGYHEYSSEPRQAPTWLTERANDHLDFISEEDTVAQVDPLRLCRWLLERCLRLGVRLHQPARAVKVSRDEAGEMSGIKIRHHQGETEHKIPCTRLLVAAGAWTPQVYADLFPTSDWKVPITSLAGHSLVVKSPRWTPEVEKQGSHAVFTTLRSGFSPEIFSRVGEGIYVAGLNDATIPLPKLPTDAKIDAESVQQLKGVAQKLLGIDGESELEVVREGLCFRPVTSQGVPIIARVSDDLLGEGLQTRESPGGGVFVSAGHGPWGISHSLGTGKVLQEMMEGQELSADVSRLGLQ